MHRYLLLAGFLGIMSLPALAQTKAKAPAKKPSTALAKNTALRFKTSWGIFLGDSLPKNELIKLLDSPLVVRDNKNNKFPVVSFNFTYEKKEVYLNDTTGKPGYYSEAIGEHFNGPKLDTLWSNQVKTTLSKGEVLYFNDIIVNYTGNKLYRVPAIQFTVN
jgi:hypothetical protein